MLGDRAGLLPGFTSYSWPDANPDGGLKGRRSMKPGFLLSALAAMIAVGGSAHAQNPSVDQALSRAQECLAQSRDCTAETTAWASALGRDLGNVSSFAEGLVRLCETMRPPPEVQRRCDGLSLFSIGLDVGRFGSGLEAEIQACGDRPGRLRDCHEMILQSHRDLMTKHGLPAVPPIESTVTVPVSDPFLARFMGYVAAFYGHTCDSITSGSGDLRRFSLACNQGTRRYAIYLRDGSMMVSADGVE